MLNRAGVGGRTFSYHCQVGLQLAVRPDTHRPRFPTWIPFQDTCVGPTPFVYEPRLYIPVKRILLPPPPHTPHLHAAPPAHPTIRGSTPPPPLPHHTPVPSTGPKVLEHMGFGCLDTPRQEHPPATHSPPPPTGCSWRSGFHPPALPLPVLLAVLVGNFPRDVT